MINNILEHNRIVQNNIFKAFGVDIEKAAAQIGEIRHWGDGIYKKIEIGKWVKISNNKEKKIASSGMIKKLIKKNEELELELLKFKQNFRKNFVSKYSEKSLLYKVFFEKAWIDEQSKNKFIKKIKNEQKELLEEIDEIKKAIEIDKKKKREIETGKKELDISDINDFINNAKTLFNKINKEIKRHVNAKQLMPEVTTEDYYFDTETTYRSVLIGKEEGYEIFQIWNDMKQNDSYHWHKSPKSISEYLVNKNTGDIYRFSNHWGVVASCNWYIESKSEQNYDIAKSNIKDFKRKESGIYFNPQYRIKMLEASEFILPKLKELVNENKDFYLTNKAKKFVLNFAEEIFHNLQYSSDLSIEEISKLKKKYDLI